MIRLPSLFQDISLACFNVSVKFGIMFPVANPAIIDGLAKDPKEAFYEAC